MPLAIRQLVSAALLPSPVVGTNQTAGSYQLQAITRLRDCLELVASGGLVGTDNR